MVAGSECPMNLLDDAHVPSLGSESARGGPWYATTQRWVLPVALLAVLGTGIGALHVANDEAPATMLGASSAVDGGLARINGIVPLETDGWEPPSGVALPGTARAGAHRVRVLLELTALDADGLEFEASDYRIRHVGPDKPRPLWSSPAERQVGQGGNIHATLIFEIPDRAIELVLDGPGDMRLSLGTGHHSGGR